ncbi:TPA: flagellar hook-basal body complex protein FliE [bacterium]|nr:flagellar hook-basal body complex protein FliE [bacterium]
MEVDLFSLLPQPIVEQKVTKVQKKDNVLFDLVLKGLSASNKQQKEANILAQKLVVGELENLHDLTIAASKAEVSLQLIMTIRNSLIRAYQEIMGLGR